MTAALRLCAFLLLLLCVLSPGCSRESSELSERSGSSEVPTPSANLPRTSISDPLTEQDIQTFLIVLEAMPGGQAPEFEPLSQATASKRQTASQLVHVYRQEFRATFDASRHGARWRKKDDLMATFASQDVTPEDFAALMIRMSCAVAAGAINPQVDLRQISERADADVARLVAEIDRIDASERTPQAVEYRTQVLEALQNTVAYSEFARILQEVPVASREVLARNRSRLAGHLPQTGSLEQFEQTIESQIVPTNFEQTAPSPPSR